MPEDQYESLIVLLEERGHSTAEIDKIINKVREYDNKTQHDSVMDSIGSGSMNLDDLVADALGEKSAES